MPKLPTHTLTWSAECGVYELRSPDQPPQHIVLTDEESWLAWLTTHTSFSFQGQSGHLSALKESRPRGAGYWYAYRWHQGHMHKHYLGRTTMLTLAHLEAVAQELSSSPSSEAPQAQMSSHVARSGRARQNVRALTLTSQRDEPWAETLVTKLSPPPLPTSLVQRERLLIRLEAALAHPLMLVSASAGWGKTTLLSAWASRQKAHIAWLSLDELDNHPTRFWVAVIATLRRCGSRTEKLGATAMELLQSSQPPPLSAILTALLNELANTDAPAAPIVLILDDYQVIDQQAVHDSLTFWLQHLPAHLHVILSSRVDPDLPLARLRVRGQLAEIRDTDLCFHWEEARDFLAQMLSHTLVEEEVRLLTSRTEGWIAGLQLACLALRQHKNHSAFLQAFRGSYRYLQDYVQQEILAPLPSALQDFLLHTSVLHRMTASLCQAVTLQTHAQELLERIERANLLLVPLDEESRWYRLHELFRSALLSRLHTSQPEMVPLLHQRAALWYETQGEWHEAISHLLAAQDYSSAARLMEQVAEQFWLRGEIMTLYQWVMALPNGVIREHARFVLTVAWYLVNSSAHAMKDQVRRARAQAEHVMARVEEAALWGGKGRQSNGLPATELTLLRRRLHLLRLSIEMYEYEVKNELEQLPIIEQQMQQYRDQEDEMIWQMIPLSCQFLVHFALRETGTRLLPRLLEARRKTSQSGDRFAIMKIQQWLVLIYWQAGQLRQAHQESLEALALLEQFAGYALLTSYFHLSLALILYHWNLLEETRNLLRKVIQEVAAWQQHDLQRWAHLALAELELATGNLTAADQALQEAEHLLHQQRNTSSQSWLEYIRVHWWLARGDLTEASDWAARVASRYDTEDSASLLMGEAMEVFALTRVYLAQQEYDRAVRILDRFRVHLDRPRNTWFSLYFLALSLVALHQSGKSQEARAVAAHLFSLTEPEGFVRIYLDLGAPMHKALLALLERAPDPQESASAISHTYVFHLLAAFEQAKPQRIRQAEDLPVKRQEVRARPSAHMPRGSPDASPAAPSMPMPIEPLSRQERRVLLLLASGCSNQEIASDLVISINTVKAHVKKIYSKLYVSNRVEVYKAAQALHLL